jgi:hypothetical protein
MLRCETRGSIYYNKNATSKRKGKGTYDEKVGGACTPSWQRHLDEKEQRMKAKNKINISRIKVDMFIT